jgi:glycerol dehydrogenase-like iron-containing ADH family enzyme
MSLMIGAAVAGLGDLVVRYYTTDSLAERTMLREIMLKGIDLAGEVREDQANRIIAALDRALNNKSRQRRPQAV